MTPAADGNQQTMQPGGETSFPFNRFFITKAGFSQLKVKSPSTCDIISGYILQSCFTEAETVIGVNDNRMYTVVPHIVAASDESFDIFRIK